MDDDLSDELRDLLVRQACRDLVLRAAAHTDAQAHERFAALFTPEGVLVRPGAEPLVGRAAIVASYRTRPATRITRHLVTDTLVQVESPTRARARSNVLLWTGSADTPVERYGRRADAVEALGTFDDVIERTQEGWRIARREASFQLYR
jgi:uncharacterized protein (TIGR02246 family)